MGLDKIDKGLEGFISTVATGVAVGFICYTAPILFYHNMINPSRENKTFSLLSEEKSVKRYLELREKEFYEIETNSDLLVEFKTLLQDPEITSYKNFKRKIDEKRSSDFAAGIVGGGALGLLLSPLAVYRKLREEDKKIIEEEENERD